MGNSIDYNNKKQVLDLFKKHFKPHEIADKEIVDTCKQKGIDIYRYVDYSAMATMVFFRCELFNSAIRLNSTGFGFTWRGLRVGRSPWYSELSAHSFFKAFDFDVIGWTAEDVRSMIIQNQEKLPFYIRLEGTVDWVHMDTLRNHDAAEMNEDKIIVFYP